MPGLRGSYGLTAISIDADEDGWPDIFVACDSTPSLLLLNNHDGTFREEALFRGIALSGDGRKLGGMGVGAGDYNLDGHIDLVKTHFYNQPTGLYRNDGKANFEDVTIEAGLNKVTHYVSFGAGFADFDNDGYPDILHLDRLPLSPNLTAWSPTFLRAALAFSFATRATAHLSKWARRPDPASARAILRRGAAFGDFDNDGDMDVLIMNVNEPPSLLRNDAPAGNHWIKIRLEGTKSNRSAIGSRVLARYGGKVQVQEVVSGSSFISASDPRLHFGLGSATTADIEIHWPLGAVEKYPGLAAGQLVTIREGQGIVKGRPFANAFRK